MASPLKYKIGIVVFSLVAYVVLHLLENNFYRKGTIKRWGEPLTWADFAGLPAPFDRFDAAVLSGLFLEQDSSGKYRAYAGQDNMRSWVKPASTTSDDLLRHEQYHFNISEVHARYLNQYIADMPGQSGEFYVNHLYFLRKALAEMQDKYDTETNHSLNADIQRYWEYKIDSMLTNGEGWVTDQTTGAKCFFPKEPVLEKGITDTGLAFKRYSLTSYKTILSMTTFQTGNSTYDQWLDIILEPDSADTDSLIYVNRDESPAGSRAYVVKKDSSGFTTHYLWIHSGRNLYRVMVEPPKNVPDSTGYNKMAHSFINSFALVDTDDFWRGQLLENTTILKIGMVDAPKKPVKKSSLCIELGSRNKVGILRDPIWTDQHVIIPFEPIAHTDSLRLRDIMYYNQSSYHLMPDSGKHFFLMPAEDVVAGSVDLGYILKEDGERPCYRYFRESIPLRVKSERVASR